MAEIFNEILVGRAAKGAPMIMEVAAVVAIAVGAPEILTVAAVGALLVRFTKG